MIKSYRDLIVWQKSMQLVTRVYRKTKILPKEDFESIDEQSREIERMLSSLIKKVGEHK